MLVIVPLLFTTLLAMNVVWLGYQKAQLTAIATRTALYAALADTSLAESKAFAAQQLTQWLGEPCSVDIAISEFADVAISCNQLEVRANAISELY